MSGLIGYLNNPVKIIAGADAPGAKEWTFDNNGNIKLPVGGDIVNFSGTSVLGIEATSGNIIFNNDIIGNNVQGNSIIVQTADTESTVYSWIFNTDGSLTLPEVGALTQTGNITKNSSSEITTGSPTVIWSSSSARISSVKLVLQLEQEQVGDLTGLHTHSCEAIVSARGNTQTDTPAISVFGVIYTSLASLVTFSVQRNVTTKNIEVLATLVDSTNPAYLRINSIEMLTLGVSIF